MDNLPVKRDLARFASSSVESRFMRAIRSEIVPDDRRQLRFFNRERLSIGLDQGHDQATRSAELFACYGLFTTPETADVQESLL